MRWRIVLRSGLAATGLVLILAAGSVAGEAAPVQTQCRACHENIAAGISAGKHARNDCLLCHAPGNHVNNPAAEKPGTDLSPDGCGRCHRDQYETYFKVNMQKPAKLEKAVPEGRAPALDLLLMPHGFTKEHNEPRSHAFMLIDHLLVDRAYGGRFQLKDLTDISRPAPAWDVLEDRGRKLLETANAANPVCLTCKSSDQILKWAYMGDKNEKATWDRTSDVVEVAKDLQNPMACIQCHDPHTARPRVVRDALIEAIERDGAYPYRPDPMKGWVQVETFRDFRKVAVLPRSDSNLMCAQCHVEYNCNPGIDPKTGEAIKMDDRRTNHFPWKNVYDIQEHYDQLSFRDFRHAVTGALLIKVQHPEAEVFWGSKHEQAGVECKDCHMPRVKNEAGDEFTSHWQTSPRHYPVEQTCGRCHQGWTQVDMEYQIDSVQNYIRGKMRKAEFWLSRFISTFETARRLGVDEKVLDQVRPYHDTAHVHWEWWTAENSDGFHNPGQARDSLVKSIEASKKGIEILEQAIKDIDPAAVLPGAADRTARTYASTAGILALVALGVAALSVVRRR